MKVVFNIKSYIFSSESNLKVVFIILQEWSIKKIKAIFFLHFLFQSILKAKIFHIKNSLWCYLSTLIYCTRIIFLSNKLPMVTNYIILVLSINPYAAAGPNNALLFLSSATKLTGINFDSVTYLREKRKVFTGYVILWFTKFQ